MFPLQKQHEIWRKVIRVWLLLDYKPTKKRCFLSRFFPTPKHQKDRGWRYYHTLCVLGSGKVVHLCRMWNRRGVSCMTRFRQTTRPVISVCWKLLGGFPGMAGKTIQLEMSKCIVYIDVYCWQYLIYIWNYMPSLWQKWCYFLHTWQSSFIDLTATRQQETWWPLVPGDWRIPTATPFKFDIDIQVF